MFFPTRGPKNEIWSGALAQRCIWRQSLTALKTLWTSHQKMKKSFPTEWHYEMCLSSHMRNTLCLIFNDFFSFFNFGKLVYYIVLNYVRVNSWWPVLILNHFSTDANPTRHQAECQAVPLTGLLHLSCLNYNYFKLAGYYTYLGFLNKLNFLSQLENKNGILENPPLLEEDTSCSVYTITSLSHMP